MLFCDEPKRSGFLRDPVLPCRPPPPSAMPTRLMLPRQRQAHLPAVRSDRHWFSKTLDSLAQRLERRSPRAERSRDRGHLTGDHDWRENESSGKAIFFFFGLFLSPLLPRSIGPDVGPRRRPCDGLLVADTETVPLASSSLVFCLPLDADGRGKNRTDGARK